MTKVNEIMHSLYHYATDCLYPMFKQARLVEVHINTMQIKVFHNNLPISMPPNYLLMISRETRQYHPNHFKLPPISTAVHQKGFFSEQYSLLATITHGSRL